MRTGITLLRRQKQEDDIRELPVIALAGNPNVGKSTVFNALTGLRQHTGNWPGKTVAAASGVCRFHGQDYVIADLPGSYSLFAHSPEEEAAWQFIASGKTQLVIAVCDATCLERNLNLVLQLVEICPRLIVCLNLMDEAERKGVFIDRERLSQLLQVPVIGITARKKRTIIPLMEAAEQEIKKPEHPVRSIPSDDVEARQREAQRIAEAVVDHAATAHTSVDRRIDRLLTGKAFGYPCMLLLLILILWLTIKGSNYPSELLSRGLMRLGDALSAGLNAIGVPRWLHDALILGIYRVLSWVVSVMLPPMAVFFPLFTLLEDTGYLPRVAFNLDRSFHRCSACGKQALTMAMGFGCNAVGVMGCRIIDSPRERLLAILTNSLVPCNGRFPLLITLIVIFFAPNSAVLSSLLLALFMLLGIGATFAATKLLSSTLLKGVPSFFTLELPPYRRPQPVKILVRSISERTLFVLGRAAAVAAPAGLLLWCLANVSVGGQDLLRLTARTIDPLGRFLGMDGVILLAFILGWPANETVLPIALMIYLSQNSLNDGYSLLRIRQVLTANGWTSVTACCTLLFTLMHWPCSTALITAYKETKSIKWTVTAALLPTAFGCAACITVRLFASLMGV